jgi:hypothetical protein
MILSMARDAETRPVIRCVLRQNKLLPKGEGLILVLLRYTLVVDKGSHELRCIGKGLAVNNRG